MPFMSTNFAWKHEYNVKLWRHKQRTPNTNDHHMPLKGPPSWKFSAYATEREHEIRSLCHRTITKMRLRFSNKFLLNPLRSTWVKRCLDSGAAASVRHLQVSHRLLLNKSSETKATVCKAWHPWHVSPRQKSAVTNVLCFQLFTEPKFSHIFGTVFNCWGLCNNDRKSVVSR